MDFLTPYLIILGYTLTAILIAGFIHGSNIFENEPTPIAWASLLWPLTILLWIAIGVFILGTYIFDTVQRLWGINENRPRH